MVIHYIYFILQSIINYIHLCAYIILYTSINSDGNTKLPDQENSLQFNLEDFCLADLTRAVRSVHPKARQFYSFKNQTDFDHKWEQKENDWVFVCGDIWDKVVKTDGLTQILTQRRLFINDWQCPALSASISAPTTILLLPRYLTNEDNVVSHLTVIIAIQFKSRDEFFFWWLMVAGYEHCSLTFQMVHCWTRYC